MHTKPEIPEGLNSEFRLALEQLHNMFEYNQEVTNAKFKVIYWLMGLAVALAGLVLGGVVNVALQL